MFEVWKKFKHWMAQDGHCRRQRLTLGVHATIAELIILSLVFFVLFFCSYACSKKRREEAAGPLRKLEPAEAEMSNVQLSQPSPWAAVQPQQGAMQPQHFGVAPAYLHQVDGQYGGNSRL